MAGGEAAIQDEFDSHHATSTDDHGWTDLRWLQYLRYEKAQEREPPEGALGPTYDKGHAGMSLDVFTQNMQTISSGLKRAHVLALRLYTSPVYLNISKPLHDGCSVARPHPYPATVALITEALKKVRADQLKKADDATAPSAVGTLWCAVAKLGDGTSEFKQRGGTEISVLSTSKQREVAQSRALQDYMMTRSMNPKAEVSAPTLLKLRADTLERSGLDLSGLSVLPDECEAVFPPCTYLEPRKESEENVLGPTGEEMPIKIIEVIPSCD